MNSVHDIKHFGPGRDPCIVLYTKRRPSDVDIKTVKQITSKYRSTEPIELHVQSIVLLAAERAMVHPHVYVLEGYDDVFLVKG